jgi:hypothetical protein
MGAKFAGMAENSLKWEKMRRNGRKWLAHSI